MKPKSYLIKNSVLKPSDFGSWGEYMEANNKKTAIIKESTNLATVASLIEHLKQFPPDAKVAIDIEGMITQIDLVSRFKPFQYKEELEYRQRGFKEDAMEYGTDDPETQQWLKEINAVKSIGPNAIII